MSKRGYYLGGHTVISGRNQSWFARASEKAKAKAQGKAKEEKSKKLEIKLRKDAIRKAEYEAYLRAAEQGGILIKTKSISKKIYKVRRARKPLNALTELPALVPDQTAVVQSVRGRRRVVPVVVRRNRKAIQQKSK